MSLRFWTPPSLRPPYTDSESDGSGSLLPSPLQQGSHSPIDQSKSPDHDMTTNTMDALDPLDPLDLIDISSAGLGPSLPLVAPPSPLRLPSPCFCADHSPASLPLDFMTPPLPPSPSPLSLSQSPLPSMKTKQKWHKMFQALVMSYRAENAKREAYVPPCPIHRPFTSSEWVPPSSGLFRGWFPFKSHTTV